jgi:mannose-1-phosphate guanylyltransferase
LRGGRWAVVLAGGDGMRLRPLTSRLYGDERPKQFCPILGGKTLIASTRARLASVAPADQTMFIVVKAHQPYYETELADVRSSRLIVQPVNKGTTAAIIYSVLRACRLDKNAVIGFFPTDHHYADEPAFIKAVETAYRVAARGHNFLVVLAADPTGPEVDYGWIEPLPRSGNHSRHHLYRVSRFREKPSHQLAQRILERGGLWNTFITVGRAGTFLDVLDQTTPDIMRRFSALAEARIPNQEYEQAVRIYDALPTGDFSRQVLSMCTDRLIALRAPDTGWSDLGDPGRVAAVMAHAITQSERQMGSAA